MYGTVFSAHQTHLNLTPTSVYYHSPTLLCNTFFLSSFLSLIISPRLAMVFLLIHCLVTRLRFHFLFLRHLLFCFLFSLRFVSNFNFFHVSYSRFSHISYLHLFGFTPV